MTRRSSTFGVPTILAITTIIALIVGLLGDGAVDVAAWIGLGVPLVAIGKALRAQRSARRLDGTNRLRR
jgi:hypothetical protein